MAAPQSVFETFCVRDKSTGEELRILLAKPLKEYVGTLTDQTQQMAKFKELFHLDETIAVKLESGETGLMGLVKTGGDNAVFHNLSTTSASRRSRSLVRDSNGNEYVVCNDGGLNTLADTSIGTILSSFANIIVLYITIKSAYYVITSSSNWNVYKGSLKIQEGTGGQVPAKATSQEKVYYHDSSLNMDNPQVDSGEQIKFDIFVNNAEGTRNIQTWVQTQARVLWNSGRPEWHFRSTEPSYLRDMTEAAVSKVDVFEADIAKFATLGNRPATVPLTPPQLYKGVYDEYPTMKIAVTSGWYYCQTLGTYAGKDYTSRAWYVDANGKGNYYKDLTNPITRIYVGALLEQDTPSGTVQYFTRTLTVYAKIQGGWHESNNVTGIEVKIGISGMVATNALLLTDVNGNNVEYQSNIGRVIINTTLTPSNLTYEKKYTNLYFTQAQMNAAGGTQYLDINGATHAQMSQKYYTITCIYKDGTEKEFEGQIHWESNPIGVSTEG